VVELKPLNFRFHLESILEEFSTYSSIYGYSSKYFLNPDSKFDYSVELYGKKAASPLGPAAGPHTQLTQNIILSWLHGSRIIELKTIQVLDSLQIPRPCIDMRNVGYNVEWSQELSLTESFSEYAAAWTLIHLLPHCEIFEAAPDSSFYHTIFDMSAGYDLAGISSSAVGQWLKNMADARQEIEAQLDTLPVKFDHLKNLKIPSQISDSITLSTFHGCPANEIEDIVRHLILKHDMNVIVKMNPTLAGFDFTQNLLNNTLGYRHIELQPDAFERDLSFEQAVPMMQRLQNLAREKGKTVGAKFTNTLVVKNNEYYFNEPERYLSGPPLYVLAMHLVQKFRKSVGADFPVSFSGGINKDNFTEAVACNMAPVTTCTDLLKKGGYKKLFYYMDKLKQAMENTGTSNLNDFIRSSAGQNSSVAEAGMYNTKVAYDHALENPSYQQNKNEQIPKKINSQLTLFDCLSCDICIPVCPNAANFSFTSGKVDWPVMEYELKEGRLTDNAQGRFVLQKETQIGNIADFCNACGNCDTFCPEQGGPFIEKPQFFIYEETFRMAADSDGFYLADQNTLYIRIEKQEYKMIFDHANNQYSWSNGIWQLDFNEDSQLISYENLNESIVSNKKFYIAKVVFDAIRREPKRYPNSILLDS